MARVTAKKNSMPVKAVETDDVVAEPVRDRKSRFAEIIANYFGDYAQYLRMPQEQAMYRRKLRDYASEAYSEVAALFGCAED